MSIHRSLTRQLRRTLGLGDEAERESTLARVAALAGQPGMDPAVAAVLANLRTLIDAVDASYVQADRDLALRTRSLELSSSELNAANSRLREDIAGRARAAHALREAAAQLLGGETIGGDGAEDELESLSRIIANLVQEREKQRLQLDNLKAALDAHAIVSITDTQGNILYANDRFCEISGYAREELIGRNHRIVKSARHPQTLYETMWQTITAGKTWHGEICNRAKNGREYWVAATIVPFLDTHGLPYEYIAIRTDISVRKKAEQDLIQARDAAEVANRAKSDFLANMSHEIRTPMNGILGMTDLALDTVLNDEQREYLQIVKSSAESLLTVINDILDFSKIEAGKLQVERIGFNLSRTVADTLKTLALRAQQKGLALICDIEPGVPERVRGDPGRLRQILLNLVGNAIKFTERGQIVVRTRVEAQTAETAAIQISVQDSGIGIAAEKLEHVFEAFAQADTSTTRQFGGTGLGLTISNRLVELMGGRLWVESQLGSGSTFHFTLVLGIETAGESAVQASLFPEAAATELCVLLVEDNPVNQQLGIRLLEKWGHRVTLAVNGQEALDKIVARVSFDAVLMDMQMPVMGGVEATQRIRAFEAEAGLPRLPIIAMTANAMQGDREICLAAGMDDYLAKPIKALDLAAKLAGLKQQDFPDTRSASPVARLRSLVVAPAFDYQAALKGMDQEIVEIIASAFLDHYRDELNALRRSIDAGDAPAAHRHAHGLKGTLAAFGAQPAERRAAEIEALAKVGDLAGSDALYPDLAAETEKLAVTLRSAA